MFRKMPANLRKLKALAAGLLMPAGPAALRANVQPDARGGGGSASWSDQKRVNWALRDQIRCVLALPPDRQTNFLRKRVAFRMSCL